MRRVLQHYSIFILGDVSNIKIAYIYNCNDGALVRLKMSLCDLSISFREGIFEDKEICFAQRVGKNSLPTFSAKVEPPLVFFVFHSFIESPQLE